LLLLLLLLLLRRTGLVKGRIAEPIAGIIHGGPETLLAGSILGV
jgi:hypothetical protein